jgi:predicted CoA-binding protein
VEDRAVPNNETIQETQMEPRNLAEKAKTIAVVGASEDPRRASHQVMHYLIQCGYDVIPVNPSAETVLGKACVASLAEIDRPVDIVDVFRRSSAAADVAQEAAAAGATCLWLQEGVRSEEARRIAEEAGMAFVQDRCIKKVLLGW